MATRSWQEMRGAATRFVTEWRDETRERAEKDSFWNEWFAIFGIDRRRVAVFEHLSTRHSTGGRGFMDVFWPGYVAAEHKSRGSDLRAAMDQALDYLPAIPAEHLPRLVVVSDFARFRVRNQLNGEETEFPLEQLAAKLRTFAPMLDAEMTQYETEEDVNLRATALLADLHDALRASGYEGHPLRVLLVRLVFVLFADDTQVWEPGHFYDYLLLRTSVDGHDLGPALIHLFQVLHTPKDRRTRTLDEDLARFEYINGGLFAETIPIPDCTRPMREALLAAARFDWSKISPAIFGSLFQNVMEPAERRKLGAHYTTEQNILRTIEPLFLKDLRAELEAATTLPALRRFRDKLATLTWLDPAAGVGNFLIISYRELRRLELECLRRIRQRERGSTAELTVDVQIESKVRVGQFYGIEVEEFPARIAETAMYLVDHLANLELSAAFGQYYARFPIEDSAHITIGNALDMDWNDVLPAARATYALGNPPFVGKQHRTDEQKADMARVFGRSPGHGVLDYVAAWYRKAADYAHGHSTRVAFVATNSIVQGEQVPALWPYLIGRGMVIDFAHRTFEWTSEARGPAKVHVIIVGFSHGGRPGKRSLFDYATLRETDAVELQVNNINPYLVNAPTAVAARRRVPLVPVSACRFGNMPNDEGHLIVEADERDELVASDPVAAKYLRELIGADEMINGEHRYCLWLESANPADIRNSDVLRSRVAAVREYRLKSTRAATQTLAATPALFGEIRQPRSRYLCLPRHTSQNREYIPMAYFDADDIAHDSTLTVEGASLYLFGVLNSEMFMTWVRTVAGRLKSDFRLSTELVYNTFPWPDVRMEKIFEIQDLAQAVLDARYDFPESTLADLYDPASMPPELARAHVAVSRAVAGLFGRRRMTSELDRQAVLFDRYAELVAAGQLPSAGEGRPRRRRVG